MYTDLSFTVEGVLVTTNQKLNNYSGRSLKVLDLAQRHFLKFAQF